MAVSKFNGFPGECIPFLQQLADNNEREWFHANKARYEFCVREPALAFIEEMAPHLSTLSPHFRAIAKKSGGSLLRVYRDIRYTKDKTPYKTNIGIQFRHELGRDVHAPGFYLHIEPGECFVGVGIWHPESKVLARIRDFIIDNPASWKKALAHSAFRKNYTLVGESLIRPPRGYPADHPLLEDLKRKDFIAFKHFDCKEINQKEFALSVIRSYKQAELFISYLCSAVGVEYE